MAGESVSAGDNRTVFLDGAKLASLRRGRALSREQLAELADGAHRLSVATIKRAEAGAPVYLETARRLAGLLGVPSVAELLLAGDSGAPSASSRLEAVQTGVAVRPLRLIGVEPRARILADGITEDLTTRLGKCWFPVISYGSVLGLSDAGYDRVASELAAAYLVEGSVQQSDDRFRLHFRLNETRSGRVLWAEEFNRRDADLLVLQDELTCRIVESVKNQVLDAEVRATDHRDTKDLESFQLTARGIQLYYHYRPAANTEARSLFRKAVERDRGAIHAWFLLAQTYQQDLIQQWSPDPRASLHGFAEVAARFSSLHFSDARAQLTSAFARLYEGKRELAHECVSRALTSASNLHSAYAVLAQVMAMAGDPASALEQIEIALRLNPLGADLWVLKTVTALIHFAAEEYRESMAWAESALDLQPEGTVPLGTLAAAAALSGDVSRARSAGARMLGLGARRAKDMLNLVAVSTERPILERYMSGLRVAGVAD